MKEPVHEAAETALKRYLDSHTLDRWGAAVASVPALLLARAFWMESAIDPLTPSALILDRALQVLTAFGAIALVFLLIAGQRLALYSAAFIGAVGALLGAAVAFSGIVRPPRAMNVIWSSSGVFILSAGMLVRYGRQIPQLRSIPARLIAGIAAAAVPVLQLWNGAAFLPEHTEATVTQTIVPTVVEATDKEFRLQISYDAENSTAARVLVTGSAMTVCWLPAEPTEKQLTEVVDNPPASAKNCTKVAPIERNSSIAGSSTFHFEAVFLVPIEAPRLTVISRISYTRGDRLRVVANPTKHNSVGKCADLEFYSVKEESRVKGLAQPDKYLAYGDVRGDGLFRSFFDVGPRFDCPSPDSAGLKEYFGANSGRIVVTEWLAPPS